MRGFGERVQYSVFRCELTELQLARMESALSEVIAPRQDQIIVGGLGLASRIDDWDIVTLGIPLDDPERLVRIV